MEDVERGVIEKFFGEGAFRPVGFLRIFIEEDAEVFFEEGGEADALAVEQLGGEHGVEQAFRAEAAEVVQEADVKVAAVHQEVFCGEAFPERGEVEGCEDVDEEYFASDKKLEEADAGSVVVEVVGLGIEGGFVGPVERCQQRCELR